jgi:Flp pilus assembly pilin Flp
MLFSPHEKGQGLVEYALLLALLALALVAALFAFGNNLFEYYLNQIVNVFVAATGP